MQKLLRIALRMDLRLKFVEQSEFCSLGALLGTSDLASTSREGLICDLTITPLHLQPYYSLGAVQNTCNYVSNNAAA